MKLCLNGRTECLLITLLIKICNFIGGESIKVNESLFQDMEELDTEIDSLGLDDDEDIYLGENSLDDD